MLNKVSSVLWNLADIDEPNPRNAGGKRGDNPFPVTIAYQIKWRLIGVEANHVEADDSQLYEQIRLNETHIDMIRSSYRQWYELASVEVNRRLTKENSPNPRTVLLRFSAPSKVGPTEGQESPFQLLQEWIKYLESVVRRSQDPELVIMAGNTAAQLKEVDSIWQKFTGEIKNLSVIEHPEHQQLFDELVTRTLGEISEILERGWGDSYLRQTLSFTVDWDMIQSLSETADTPRKALQQLRQLSVLEPYFNQQRLGTGGSITLLEKELNDAMVTQWTTLKNYW